MVKLFIMKKLIIFCFITVSAFQTVSAQEAMLGEIRLFAGNFAPRGWAFCNGQQLSISSNSALFSILGTMYGGDGRTKFALPDLRARVPIGAGVLKNGARIPVGKTYSNKGLTEVTGPSGKKLKGKKRSMQSSVGLHYIICTQGFFPSRS